MNRLTKRLIIFLVRKRLDLKKYEAFRFSNQKSKTEFYYFSDTEVRKIGGMYFEAGSEPSSVSLNWLLDDNCQIKKLGFDARGNYAADCI